MPKQHEVVDLGERIMQELSQDPPKLAEALFGTSQPDAQNVGKPEYVAMVRRAYEQGDVATRQKMAKANPAAFNAAAKEIGVVMPGDPTHSKTPIAPATTGQEMAPPPVNQVPPAAQPPVSPAMPAPPMPQPSGAILPGQPQVPQLPMVPQTPPPPPMPGVIPQ